MDSRRRRLLADGREFGKAYRVKDMNALRSAVAPCDVHHPGEIAAVAPYGHQVDVGRERGKGPYGQLEVLAAFDRADLHDVPFRKAVFPACFGESVPGGRMLEYLGAPLIDHVDFFRVDAVDFCYVVFCALAHGDDTVGDAARDAVFEIVDDAVGQGIAVRKTPVYHVMDGYHRGDSGRLDVEGQLVAQPVEKVYPFFADLGRDAEGAP